MVFTTRGGIAGVALIWTARAIVDTLVMFVMARRLTGPGHLHLGAKTGAGLAAVAAFAGLSNVASLPLRMVGFTLIVAGFSWWGFRFGLSGGEKALMGRLSRGFTKK
jgi:hypothetical protein